MKAKIQLFAVLTGACLTSGCIVPASYPCYSGPVEYGAPVPPDEIVVPEVIIVENGVRHDRFFYQRHPEFYRRDRMRYPQRFVHLPPSHHGVVKYRGHVPPPHAIPGRPFARPGDPHQASHGKKKKHHDDDHDRD